MTLTVNSLVVGFLLAVLVYFLFGALVDAFVTRPDAKEMFHKVLLVICVIIILFVSFAIRI